MNTGLRRGEVLGPRWKDPDLDARQLQIVQTVTAIDRVTHVSPGTKGGAGVHSSRSTRDRGGAETASKLVAE